MKKKLSGSQIKRLIIVLVVLGLAAITAILIGGPLVFWSLLAWLVNKTVSNVGMNVWLARGLMVPVAALLFYAIGLTFSLKKRKRTTGAVLLCVFLCLGSLAMYNFTKEQHFRIGTNEPAQWYSKTPNGYKLYPRPGYDPITGEQLQKVTPEVAKEIEILKQDKGKIIKPVQEEYQFFDFWGRPIRWYHKDAKGKIEIFDQPGSHPTYGEPLLPVTKEIVKEYLGQIGFLWINEFPLQNESKQPKERIIKYTYINYETARIESLKLYLDCQERSRQILPEIDEYCFQKINALINELGEEPHWRRDTTTRRETAKTFIRAWEAFSPELKLIEPSAAKIVYNVPIYLVSMEVEEGIEFIKQHIQIIEESKKEHYMFDYDGESVMIRIIEVLDSDLEDYDYSLKTEVKDLLNFIVQNSIWPKAREYAAEVLTRHKQ